MSILGRFFGRRPARAFDACGWIGQHSADPTPVTVIRVRRTCGHLVPGHGEVPTCAKHLEQLVPTTRPETCETCGKLGTITVSERYPAR